MLNSTIKIVAVSIMTLAGSFDTLVFKTQNQQIVEEGGVSRSFFHPYMQVGSIFLGQFLALLVFYAYRALNREQIQQNKEKAKSQGKQMKFNILWTALSAFIGSIGATLQLISLNFVASSVYQLMRGGSIATTFFFSIIFLKIKAKKYQIVGSILAFLGILVVGLSAVLFSNSAQETPGSNFSNTSTGAEIFGYILLIISIVSEGFMYTFYQWIFSKYHIQVLQYVGIQGFFGVILWIIINTIASYIPCSFAVDACAIDSSANYVIQSPSSYFHSISNDGFLLTFIILGVFSIMTYNTSATLVTKHISALARSICDILRTILIWGVGIIVTVTAGQSDSVYKWQSLNLSRILVQIVGFLLVISGNLVYNNLIGLKCLQHRNQENSSLLQRKQESNQVVLSIQHQ